MPPFALTVAYWLHMVATVVWIGGLIALAVFVIPTAQKLLDPTLCSAFLVKIQSRLQPIGWFSLAVLGMTGMFQMSANPNYSGFLLITNGWSAAILGKHLVIGLMVVSSATMTWGVLPGLQRVALLRSAAPVDDSVERRLVRRENLLLILNIILSLLVLALTAWARAL